MEVSKRERGSLSFILPFLVGSIIIVLALGNYYSILRGVYGKFASTELIPNLNELKTLFVSHKKKVAILNSAYTKNLLPAGSTWLDDNINSWKKFLDNFQYESELVSDEVIELDELSKFQIIILPGSKSLSDKQIINLKKYLLKGGSILATSGTASYSNEGKWRGWQFFSEVFGIRFSKEIKNEQITHVHTIRGGLPLSAGITAGYALKVATWDIPIAAEVLDPRSIQLSFWYDYLNEAGLVREEIKKSAGIVYGTYGKGRFVWMGFEINSVVGVLDDHVFFERLIRNSLNWLGRNPIAYVRDWPNDFNSAALILTSPRDDLSVESDFLELIKRKKIQPNFVITTNQLKSEYKQKIELLSNTGEIIPYLTFGFPSSESDTSSNLFDYQTQFEILNVAKVKYETLVSKNLEGVISQYGLFDNNTLRAMNELNYCYFISDSITGSSLPKRLFWNEKVLVGMFRNNRDDIEVINKYGLDDTLFQFYTYQEDIDRILFEGGLYIFKVNSNYLHSKSSINVFSSVIDDLQKKNYWITSASEISKWSKIRGQIEVGIKSFGNRRVRLTIFNTSDDPAHGIEIDVELPEKIYNLAITPEIIGTELPAIKKLNGGSLIRLKIDSLNNKESRIYYLDFDIVENT